MTANSDYGVSIVESFTPPANMIPGQEINKDVYAVNTGNIDAFVKESVSGVLNYTFESPVVNLDKTNCVKLAPAEVTAIDGATTMEAGGTLAYTSVTVGTTGYIAPGTVVSARESENPAVSGRWTPTASGVYIFRRSIIPAKAAGQGYVSDPDAIAAMSDDEKAANAALAPQPEKYTYAGYYYDAGTDSYYKIVIGSDPFRAYSETENDDGTMSFVFDISVDSDKLGGNAVAGADGIIEGTPEIHYVLLNSVDDANVNFGYVAADATGNEYGAPYLAVRFENESGDMEAANAALVTALENVTTAQANLEAAQNQLTEARLALGDKSKTLAEKEVALRNAEGAYNSAKSRYDQTKADYEYAKALQAATATLISKAGDRQTAEETKTTKLGTLTAAAAAVVQEATNEKDSFDTQVSGFATTYSFRQLVPEQVENYINSNGPNGFSDLSGAKDNMESLRALWNQITNLIDSIDGDYDNLNGVVATGDPATDTTPAVIDGYETSLNNHVDSLKTTIAAYKSTYAAFKAQVTETTLSGITGNTPVDLTAMTFTDNTDTMDGKVTAYDTAYNDYYDYMNGTGNYDGDTTANPPHSIGYPQELQNWADAVSAYNTAVGAAKDVYTGTGEYGINAPQTEPNAFGGLVGELGSRTLTDNGANLVANYSAFKINTYTAGEADDPTIADNTANETPDNKNEIDYTLYAGKTAPTIASTEGAFNQITADPSGTPQTLAQLESAKTTAYNSLYGETGTENAPIAGSAKADYDAAVAAITATEADALTDAQAAVDQAQAALAAANAHVNDVRDDIDAAAAKSEIQIDVVLDSKVNNGQADETWKFDTRTNNTTQADFYLDKILEAGDTSDKLVDYVVLNKKTSSADYKDLTFDLNVELKSAQVTYADNQRDYTATAVNDGNDDFAMTAAVGDDNSTVTWTTT